MSERIYTPFTNEHFVAFCEKMLGQPYWYGSVVYKCTENLRARKAKQYPAHYGSSRTARYRDDIAKKKVCADCVGLIKGYNWTNGGQGVIESIGTDRAFSSKYGGHGCPDKSANGMFNYARSKGCAWGAMDTLPEGPGIALRFDGHVGVYVGNGYAVEERGFNYGCVRTRVKDRKWTHWYQLPFVDYGDAVFTGGIGVKADTPKTEYTLGTRTLKKGAKGTDVKAMQEFLLQLGYALPEYGADGDFGNETETALKKLQARAGVKQDGVYGSETHKALMDATADNDAGKESEQPDEPDQPNKPEQPEEPTQPDAPDTPTTKRVRIVCGSGSVNIRAGNGTQYGKVFCAKCGAPYKRRTLSGGTADGAPVYHKVWNCRERQKGKAGNGCRNTSVAEEELLRGISDALGWEWKGAEEFDAERFLREVQAVHLENGAASVQKWTQRVSA